MTDLDDRLSSSVPIILNSLAEALAAAKFNQAEIHKGLGEWLRMYLDSEYTQTSFNIVKITIFVHAINPVVTTRSNRQPG